jgi:ACS family hexuronate transporter-like MFS transporter
MSTLPSRAVDSSETLGGRIGRYRWKICALLFFATTINYMDRQVLGLLAPELQKSIGWNEQEYGNIVTAFQAAYAFSLLGAGKLMDRFGTRKGYSIAIVVWSLASMAHSLARSAFQFGLARIALGIGEAGNFPAAIKTVAEWFPKKERALSIGIFNSGSNIGAIIAPLTVPLIALHLGWRWAFIFTGSLDLIWLACWLAIYRPPNENPKLSRAEREYIQSDPQEPVTKIPWAKLLPLRQTFAFAAGKFLTDPIWWFYLYWLPKFLNAQYGLSLDKIGLPLVVIYLSADVGSIGGGWLSSALIRRGWSLNAARKTTMLICAICVTPIVFASQASEVWVAVGLISLATAAHQGWSANLFASASDMFPQRAVGSVVGIGGFAGAIGGMLLAFAAGTILQITGSYVSLFIIAGSAYLIALLLIHLAVPRMQPATIDT